MKTTIATTTTAISANRYATYLVKCRKPASYALARLAHAHMITSGFTPKAHILNTLLNIYSKSSYLNYAHYLFDKMPQQDIVSRTTMLAAYSQKGNVELSREIFNETPVKLRDTVFYNAMITAYSRNNDGHNAIAVFNDMRKDGFVPDNYSYTSVLSGLAVVADKEIHCGVFHCVVVKSGTGLVTSVLNALVSVYVKCASSPFVDAGLLMGKAKKVFDEICLRDELSWTTIITGYVRNGDLESAREVFDGMNEKLVVGWNAMVSGYVHHGFVIEALDMFRKMRFLEIEFDEFTYTSALSACASAKLLVLGKEIHAYILRTGDDRFSRDFSLSVNNALMTLYWKCDSIDEARRIFDNMPAKDLVSYNAILSAYVSAGRISVARSYFSEMREKNHLTWTVMISGLAQNGFGEDGLKLFSEMKVEGFDPCDYVFAGAITSCAVLGSLENGRQVHAQLIRSGFDISLSACNALITMYGRCGVVDSANSVFLSMPFVDSVSWNALIAALGQHGQGVRALELFEQMLKDDFIPDRISFLTVLSACSHTGLVQQGQMYFDRMYTVYGITPGEDHYARLVDLLCRAGKFSEAKEFISKMPFEPGVQIWEALLGGCRIYGNMDLGIEAAERLFELTPTHDGTYVLLSNIYANKGKWDEVAKVRQLMRDRGVKKEPGCSWVEVENKVHVFLVDDAAHPEVRLVYDYLEQLDLKMRKLGYVPDNKYVLRDIEFEQRENVLSTHSEKLAVAFGLMKLPTGATVRIFKNLRICGDCHNAFKFMSSVVGREIVVRDGKRFHHFRNGECSCGNYW